MKKRYDMPKEQDEREIRELIGLMFGAELSDMERREEWKKPADFSKGFGERMDRLIRRQRRGYQVKTAVRYALSAAAVFLLIFCLTNPGRVVKAWEALVRWYRYPGHTELHMNVPEEERGKAIPEYELTYVPEGFDTVLDDYNGSEGFVHCFRFVPCGDGVSQQSISLVYSSSDAHVYYQDGETALQGRDEDGSEIFCVREGDGYIRLVWYSEKDKAVFQLIGSDSTEEEMLRVKDGIRKKQEEGS